MNQIINRKNKIREFVINILFIIYIFLFCSVFLIYSNYLHLKILIFSILLMCAISDIGGYVSGKIFKGTKLTKISPNKTYSGVVGGFLFALIAGLSQMKYMQQFKLT